MLRPCVLATVVSAIVSYPFVSVAGESVGFYAGGGLNDGVALPDEGDHHYLVIRDFCYELKGLAGAYPDPSRARNFYGHPDTVKAVLDVAKQVRTTNLGAPRLAIGELSNARGGKIPFHLSHQTGLDVDIYFLQRPDVATCRHDGKSFELKKNGVWQVDEDFDARMNWALVSAFAARRDVKVIFIGGLVRGALADYAKTNIPRAERRRTLAKLHASFCKAPPGVVMGTYKNNRCPHDDHIHVRFHCPDGSSSCRERKYRAPG